MKIAAGGCMPPLGRFGQMFKRASSANSNDGSSNPPSCSAEDSQQQEIDSYLRGISKYKAMRILGMGSYGLVILAMRQPDSVPVAIKFMTRGDRIQERVLREVRNHSILDHRNVVKFHEVFLTQKHLCIVMDYAPGRNLLQYVYKRGYLLEDSARKVFQQLILAVHYCHSVGIVSRDIKLDNTLLDDEDPPGIMICDFGYSKSSVRDSLPDSRVGTPHYLAPEIFKLNAGESYDAQKADVWSCGVFLYALLTGKYPFSQKQKGGGIGMLMHKIVTGDFHVPLNFVSEEACDLLTAMMMVPVDRRITLEEIKVHRWFAVGLDEKFEEDWDYKQTRETTPEDQVELEEMVEAAKRPGRAQEAGDLGRNSSNSSWELM